MATIDKVRRGLALYQQGISRYSLPSLDAPAGEDPDGPTIGEVALVDPRPSQEAVVVAVDLRNRLAERMAERLTTKDVAVLGLRFAGWTLGAVGQALGLPRATVHLIERDAMQKLIDREPAVVVDRVGPKPGKRPRLEQPEADPRHDRMAAIWKTELRAPGLLPAERERLETEHRALEAELRAERLAADRAEAEGGP